MPTWFLVRAILVFMIMSLVMFIIFVLAARQQAHGATWCMETAREVLETGAKHAIWYRRDGQKCWTAGRVRRRVASGKTVPSPRSRPVVAANLKYLETLVSPAPLAYAAVTPPEDRFSFSFSAWPPIEKAPAEVVIFADRLLNSGWRAWLARSLKEAELASDRLEQAQSPPGAGTDARSSRSTGQARAVRLAPAGPARRRCTVADDPWCGAR